MRYSRDFIELQISAAERVAGISGMPVERALLDYTNLYRRLGCGHDIDERIERWREFVAGFAAATDRGAWTEEFYHRSPEFAPRAAARFGCFSYEIRSGDILRLHFVPDVVDEVSPLDRSRVDERRSELTALIAHARREHPELGRVAGSSWLYNVEAYRRLFPSAYLASLEVAPGRFRYMSLWGQFVDRHGRLRSETATRFRLSLARTESLESFESCFPLQPLAGSTSVEAFRQHFGIEH